MPAAVSKSGRIVVRPSGIPADRSAAVRISSAAWTLSASSVLARTMPFRLGCDGADVVERAPGGHPVDPHVHRVVVEEWVAHSGVGDGAGGGLLGVADGVFEVDRGGVSVESGHLEHFVGCGGGAEEQ
jgi:hypothetical protein